jgi:hypothetical protein
MMTDADEREVVVPARELMFAFETRCPEARFKTSIVVYSAL